MGKPGLTTNHLTIHIGFVTHPGTSLRFSLKLTVLVTSNFLILAKPRCRKNLDTVTNTIDPLILRMKILYDLNNNRIITQILRRPTPDKEDGLIIIHIYIRKRNGRLGTISRSFK